MQVHTFGRLAFPIYAFLISEGYTHTKNFAKYLARLLLFAAISQIPAMLLFKPYLNGEPYLNIFFTLALGLISIRFYDKCKDKKIGVTLVILTAFLADLLHTDYGMLGVLLISAFYIFKNSKIKMSISAIILILLNYLININSFTLANLTQITYELSLSLFALSSLIFILLYNGKLGKSNKFIKMGFYLFYPVHLLLFYFIRVIF